MRRPCWNWVGHRMIATRSCTPAGSVVPLYINLISLDAADDAVHNVIEEKWWPHQSSYYYCVEIRSMIHSARGEQTAAIDVIETVVTQSLESGITSHIASFQSLQAEHALASGDLATASHWALEFEPGPPTAGFEFSVPALVAAKILLRSDRADAQAKGQRRFLRNISSFMSQLIIFGFSLKLWRSGLFTAPKSATKIPQTNFWGARCLWPSPVDSCAYSSTWDPA